MADESTTKINIDISELKRNIQEANRLVRLANSEFKSASAGMDNWAKSADGISAKLSQLDKTLSSQKTVLSSLEDMYKAVAAEQGENSKGAQELAIKINNQKAAISKTESEIRKWKDSLNDLNQEQKDVSSASDELKKSISEQESELASLKKKYTDLVLTQGESSEEAQQTAQAITELSSELKKSKASLSDAEKATSDLDSAMDDLDDSVEDAGESAEDSSGGFTVLKGALANLVAEGITAVVDGFKELISSTDQASNKFQAATGATAKAMEGYNDAIESIYKNNFGESLEDVAEKMAKVKEITGEVDPTKLQELTEAGITLEDTFGMDMNESLRGISNLMEHFGLTAEEAMDLMASGAQNGLNFTDELGDNVAEYSGKFAEAGYSADEYFQLLQNGSQGGAYNLDKVNDSINEVTTRLADGTIADGIGGFSKETQNLFSSWQKGGATQKEVIDSIVKDIKNTTGEQEKMNLAALAFGTMAEDGGTKFIESISSVGDTFDDTKGKMEEIKQVRYDDVMSQLEGLGRTVKLDLITPFVEELLPHIKDGVQYVIDNMPAIKEAIQPAVDVVGEFISWIVDNKDAVIAAIVGIGAGMLAWNVVSMIQGVVGAIKAFKAANEGATVAQMALNLVMKANPIGLVIAAITALVAAFIYLWNTSDEFRAFWVNLWKIITKNAKAAWDAIVLSFKLAWEAIKKSWSYAVKFFSDIWTNIKKIYSVVKKWFSDLFKAAWEGAKKAWSSAVNWFKSIWEGIKKIFSVVKSWFSNIFNSAWTAITKIWNKATGFFSGIWSNIKSVFGSVKSWFGDIFGKAWEAIKSKFSGWGKFWSGLWTQIKNKFSDIGSNIGSAISGSIRSGLNGVLSTIESTINKGIGLINSAINLANKLPGINVGNVPTLSLPRLESGGVLKKGQVGLLEGNGAEAVVPLDKNKLWIRQTAKDMVKELNSQSIAAAQKSVLSTQPVQQTFNQYIQSPKALSRLEIYRQTKNQLSFAKGV